MSRSFGLYEHSSREQMKNVNAEKEKERKRKSINSVHCWLTLWRRYTESGSLYLHFTTFTFQAQHSSWAQATLDSLIWNGSALVLFLVNLLASRSLGWTAKLIKEEKCLFIGMQLHFLIGGNHPHCQDKWKKYVTAWIIYCVSLLHILTF